MKKKLSISLPLGHNEGVAEPLFPNIQKLRSVRRGHKISRFFRHVLNHSKIKRILGSNIALAVVMTSMIPSSNAVSAIELEQTVISANEVQLTTEITTRQPLDQMIINQGFHLFHLGVDLEGVTGDPVYAIKKGVVEAVQRSKYAYGYAVFIRHEGGLNSLYAHLSKIDVEEGQSVTPLTKIGEVGSTGRSTGDHLHLEVRDGTRPLDPLSVLPK